MWRFAARCALSAFRRALLDGHTHPAREAKSSWGALSSIFS